MGTAINVDPFYTTAMRVAPHTYARYFFFFTIGIYLLSDFWNQLLQYEGYTRASAVFTLASGILVAATSVIDTLDNWNIRRTSDERLEAIFIGFYAFLVTGLGVHKINEADYDSSKAMPDREQYIIIGSYTVLFVIVLVVVYITNQGRVTHQPRPL